MMEKKTVEKLSLNFVAHAKAKLNVFNEFVEDKKAIAENVLQKAATGCHGACLIQLVLVSIK